MQIRRKKRTDDTPRHLARSLYSASSGAHDPGRYRSIPCGAADVAELVRAGMTVRTSYGTGGIVVEVVGPSVHVATNGKEYPTLRSSTCRPTASTGIRTLIAIGSTSALPSAGAS
ncbi:MAG: hypothetical protein JWL86_2292 [Rhizobium sp.]|nr:hypothetical protein [Rhizobium sp.]